MALEFLDPTLTPYAVSFLFVFAIVFGLLSITKREKTDSQGNVKESHVLFDKKINAIIALAFAIFAVTYEPFVRGLQTFLPIATILLVVAFFIVFLRSVFKRKKDKEESDTLPIAVAIAVLLIVLATVGSQILDLFQIDFDRENLLALIGLAAIVIIFFAAYSKPEKK